MTNLRVATAQFEHRSGDKAYNLQIINELSAMAAALGADVISFHECSITGYTFARHLNREEMLNLAEMLPEGESVVALKTIASRHKITILAGLFEKDAAGNLYKAQVCVNENGMIAKHRKIHPFINPHLLPGESFTIFEIKGWKCGILICYDNNIIENVRATKLLGADIIFMPHVTMCTPSPRPGAGFVDAALWVDKVSNAAELRKEFDSLKGRAWLMKWLPARAYDNAVFAVFSNAIGMDDDQLKNGCSMIIDPFGDIMAECRSLNNEVVIAEFDYQKIINAGGSRYIKARKPDLYGAIIGQEHESVQKVVWLPE